MAAKLGFGPGGWRHRSWCILEDLANDLERQAFSTLDAAFSVPGEYVASDPLSCVTRATVGGRVFYIKRYTGAGKGFRRYLGRSRLRGEWDNLTLFHRLGIPAPAIVAVGEERRLGSYQRGALVLAELRDTASLADIAYQCPERFGDRQWLWTVIQQVAEHTRRLHQHGVAHNDLRWRNIMVNMKGYPRVYFLDCPSGRRWPRPLLNYRITKDLSHLDRDARSVLSRSQRLRAYKAYSDCARLSKFDKRRITRVLRRNRNLPGL